MTYNSWLNEWLNVYKKPFVKSIKNHRLVIRIHVPESLKRTKIENLTALEVQKALNNVPQSRTRLDVYNIYHGSLTVAFKLGYIEKDIASLLLKPKHEKKVGSALSDEELQEFLIKIQNHKLYDFFLFCLYSGCRRSEALALLWSDIDFEKGLIHVRGTKTVTSDRYVPILPDCMTLFKRIKKTGKRVFPFNTDYVSHFFKKVCPNHKLHDLRHTFATKCLESGINIKVVQKWLGHSRIDTTAQIYVHVSEDYSLEEAKKFKL